MVKKKTKKKFISVVDKNSNENYQNRKSEPELYTPNYRRHSKITIPVAKPTSVWPYGFLKDLKCALHLFKLNLTASSVFAAW